tara:strand:+ start:224 stop:550 length:327 start_codon:yes stop_codon:yes gene_type:complete
MSQFYRWLLSLCCKAKIYNGLANEDDRNRCSDCGNVIVDMDKGSYDTRSKCYVFLHTYTTTDKHYVVADSKKEATAKFHIGDVEKIKYVDGTTDTVDWEFVEEEFVEL